MIKNEIGECVYVLFHQLWGKTLVKGKLRSQSWWQRRLDSIVNDSTVIQLPELDHYPTIEPPIPFEIEIGISDLDHATLLKAWKKIHP